MTGNAGTSRGFLARRRSRLWRYVSPRRRRLWTIVFVLLSGVLVAYGYFTSDGRIRALVESELTQRLGRTVTVDHASFSLFGPVEIEGLTIASKDSAALPALTARAAIIDHDPLALLKGDFEPTAAKLIGWQYTEEVDIGPQPPPPPGPPPPAPPRPRAVLPFGLFPISVRDCTIRIVYTEGGKVVETREMVLDGALEPMADDRYAVRLLGSLADGTAPAMTATLAVLDSDVEQLSLPVSVIRNIAPSTVREHLDQWQAGGTLGLSRRSVGADGKATYDIDLGQLAAAVPASEIPLTFQDIQGHVLIDTSAKRIALEGVACRVPQLGESARLVVEGSYDGFKADSPCNLQGHILSAEVPRATGKGRIEKIVASVKRTYGVSGSCDAHVTYARAAKEKAKFHGRVVLGPGVSGECKYFPLRLADMSGAIEFTEGKITLIDLKGTREGAVVTVVGSVPDMSRYALYDLTITGTGVPLDDDLQYALAKSVGKSIWDSLQPKPGGRANAVVRVSRTSHDDDAPRIGVALGLDGRAGITHTAFPYALDKLRGTVVIDSTSVRIDVAGVHGQTRATVRGAVTKIDTSDPETDLTIDASNITMDQALLKAIGPEGAEVFDDIGVRGLARSAKVHVTQGGAKGGPNYDVTAVLADVRARPSVFPYELTGIAGRVRVTPEYVVLEDLVGKHGKATVTLGGKILLTGKKAAVERLAFIARDVELDADLAAALPAEVREVWRDLAPGGSANITKGLLRHKDLAKPDELDYEIVIEPTGARVTYADFPRTVTGITGRIHVVPALVTLTGIRAAEGDMTVSLDGRVVTGKGSGARLVLSARGVPVDKQLIAAMKKVAPKGAKHIKPGGTLSVTLDKLCFGALCPPGIAAVPPPALLPAKAPLPWHVEGTVSFKDMGVDVGLGSKTLTGQFTGSSSGRGDKGLAMNAKLALDEVLVDNRRITHVRGMLLKKSDWSVLEIRDFEARAHGGKLAGKAMIGLGDPATYRIDLQVDGLKLARMAPPPKGGAKPGPPVKGQLRGSVWMYTVDDAPAKRRGAGKIYITDANLSKLPVLLELLHLIQLKLPGKTSFTAADVTYRLAGQKLTFEEIELKSSAISFTGSGTLDLKTERISLVFVDIRIGDWWSLDKLAGPALTKLFRGFGREIVEIRTTGTLAEPKTETVLLRSVDEFRKTIERMLQLRGSGD